MLRAFGPPWDQVLQLWGVASGRESRRRSLRDHGLLREAALSPDGKVLALGGGRATVLRSVPGGKALLRLSLPRGSSCCRLTLSPAGKLFMAGRGPGYVAVWDAASGKLLGTTPPHAAAGDRLSITVAARTPVETITKLTTTEPTPVHARGKASELKRRTKWPDTAPTAAPGLPGG